jgi:hypothetical protein
VANRMAGSGRELPVTLHQYQRQLSGNACVSTRLQRGNRLWRVLHTKSKVVILTSLPFSINELCIIERRTASLLAWRTTRSVCVNLPVRRFLRYVLGSRR